MAALPTNAQERKDTPIYAGVLSYFPQALAAIAGCSKKGNDQHNPGKPLHWDRSKSGDELDALTRHLLEAGTIDTDGIRHSTKVAWRALANLEKELEKVERARRDQLGTQKYGSDYKSKSTVEMPKRDRHGDVYVMGKDAYTAFGQVGYSYPGYPGAPFFV